MYFMTSAPTIRFHSSATRGNIPIIISDTSRLITEQSLGDSYTWECSHRIPLMARFMGSTWGPSGANRTQVGPMLASWTLLSGTYPPSSIHIVFPENKKTLLGFSNMLTTVIRLNPFPSVTARYINTLRLRQNGRQIPDDIFKCISLNGNICISIKIPVKFIPMGPINNISALIQTMAWHRTGDKPLSEPKVGDAYMCHSASMS